MGLVNISTFTNINDFWWNHWNDHLEIVQAINKQFSMNLPAYIIHPWTEGDQDGILGRHLQYHFDMAQVIPGIGSDLSSVDFSDEAARTSWVYSNYTEHLAARTALGI